MMWLGLAIMIASEALTLVHVEPFWSWNTPIAWTGFILFADAIVWRARGDSWLRSAPFEFALLALVSIPLWVVFEGFNLVIDNWNYTGLPENFWLRQFGYAWSFATIWPAVFEAADLFAVIRRQRRVGGAGQAGGAGRARRAGGDNTVTLSHHRGDQRRSEERVTGFSPPAPPALPALPAPPAQPALPALLSAAAGVTMLASPFLVSPATARYLAAPVWLGFIFLLDPINARLGGESLWADWRAGRHDRLINLSLSGVLCGVLWEFWNYWAHAKWHYTVPIMERWKIFEMPVPGYLGFPAFALECFTMYVFVRLLVLGPAKAGRHVRLGPAEAGRHVRTIAR